jgi:hypothetical protein
MLGTLEKKKREKRHRQELTLVIENNHVVLFVLNDLAYSRCVFVK